VMFHRHDWSAWETELRPFTEVYEREDHSFTKTFDIIFNVRKCSDCGLVQEKKAQ